MTADDSLTSVRNDRIQFATMRPPNSRSVTLDRRVRIVGPPDLVQIARSGDLQHVADLIALLRDPDRAWAAEVMLASMTGQEEKMVDAYQRDPDKWQDTLGRTAHERWTTWFEGVRDRLMWNADEGMFIERPQP